MMNQLQNLEKINKDIIEKLNMIQIKTKPNIKSKFC